MLDAVTQNPWVRAAVLVAALVGLAVLVYLLGFVLIPLFMAILVAYVLDPVVDFFERRRIPRGVTVAGLAIAATLALLAIPLLVLPGLISEANALTRAALQPADTDQTSWSGRIEGMLDRLPLDEFVTLMGWEDGSEGDRSPRAVIAQKKGEYVKANATAILQSHAGRLTGAGRSAGQHVLSLFSAMGRTVFGALLFLGNVALFSFVAGYLLKDFDGLKASATNLLPEQFRDKVVEIARKIDQQLQGFLRGQFTVCLCLGVMYAVGLLLSGTPFAILLALFGAAVSFVPYLGIVMTVIPALLLTVLRYGIDLHLVGVLATFALAQLLEGNVLTPKIVGDKVGLGPVWVILAILVFGNLLGFLGLLLAVPIAASLKVLVVEALDWYRRSDFYQGQEEATSDPGP
jgi:predicted PurR-regulated permease PerM